MSIVPDLQQNVQSKMQAYEYFLATGQCTGPKSKEKQSPSKRQDRNTCLPAADVAGHPGKEPS